MLEAQKVAARSEIPVEYTWDFTLMFPDQAAWEQAIAKIEGMVGEVSALNGKIAQSAANLLRVLELRDQIEAELWRVSSYSRQLKDVDATNPASQALDARGWSLVTRVQTALSFVNPEILSVPEATLTAWQAQEAGLKRYAFALYNLNRQRAHIRSAEIENVMAQFGDVTRAPQNIYEMLHDTELDFPTIQDENGQTVTLSHGRFGRFMLSANGRVRRDAFKGNYAAFQKVRNTLAATLAGKVRANVVNARLRGYASAQEASMKPNDIPLEVYSNLISTIEANLPRMHRYVALRKRIMGLDELHFYDMRAPLFPDVDLNIPYAEAGETVTAALTPLGADYAGVLHKTFSSRWIDVYENQGKTSGAYSGGSSLTPPYILLNYQDKLDDMYTLAHELGHSMHSYFTWQTQPLTYSDYTTFLAEVASTLNEALLTDYLLKHRDDPALRKQLIVQQLEDIRGTIFRQAMFADFEREIHRRVEADEALTNEAMSEYYYGLVAKYHGPALTLDDEIAFEWARIPHFYMNFYVYQYATGLSAALALSQQIIREGQPAVDRYLQFLRSGSSRPSIDILRDAGVDMRTPGPIQQAMDIFDGLLDELEKLA